MNVSSVKEQARQIIDHLPDEATWDDLMYQIYVRQSVAKGLADCQADRVMEVNKVRQRFGLDP